MPPYNSNKDSRVEWIIFVSRTKKAFSQRITSFNPECRGRLLSPLKRATGEGSKPYCKNTLRNKHSLCKHGVISSDNLSEQNYKEKRYFHSKMYNFIYNNSLALHKVLSITCLKLLQTLQLGPRPSGTALNQCQLPERFTAVDVTRSSK